MEIKGTGTLVRIRQKHYQTPLFRPVVRSEEFKPAVSRDNESSHRVPLFTWTRLAYRATAKFLKWATWPPLSRKASNRNSVTPSVDTPVKKLQISSSSTGKGYSKGQLGNVEINYVYCSDLLILKRRKLSFFC